MEWAAATWISQSIALFLMHLCEGVKEHFMH